MAAGLVLGLASAALLSAAAPRHGGQYRGPWNRVPNLFKRPSGKPDLETWEFWWEFNKDQFMGPRRSRAVRKAQGLPGPPRPR